MERTYNEYNYPDNNALNCKGKITRSCFISFGGNFSGIPFDATCMGIIESFYFDEYNHTNCSGGFDNEDLNDYLVWYQDKCNPYYNAISKCENGNTTIYQNDGPYCTGNNIAIITNGSCVYNSVEEAHEQLIVTDNPCI